ncbi:hypothetical protein [Streptomyces hydrogenans]
MPTPLSLTSLRPSTNEAFDFETLALLDALDVPLPVQAASIDLDVLYGTPLEMHEPAGTSWELSRYATEVTAAPPDRRYGLSLTHGAEIAARVDASRDILAADPTIPVFLCERLADFPLPRATRLLRSIHPNRRCPRSAS